MKNYLSEFLGTFTLVFAGTGAIVINDFSGGVISHSGIALTFGMVVMAMIYAFGDTSGAHLNPAVTIAFSAMKRISIKESIKYIVSQILGGFLASMVLRFSFPQNQTLGATLPSIAIPSVFVFEFLLTFILMLVIIQVATGAKEKGLLAGVAIGGTVGFEAMFAGPVTGASMNPIRSIAPAVVSGETQFLWVYILAPILGALTAVYVCKFLKK